MGNALCLAQGGKAKPPELYATARVSPIPAFRKRRRSGGGRAAGGGDAGATGPYSLLDACVAVAAAHADRLDIGVLPAELIQLVADHLIDEGARRHAGTAGRHAARGPR